jgi:hypothetical protein
LHRPDRPRWFAEFGHQRTGRWTSHLAAGPLQEKQARAVRAVDERPACGTHLAHTNRCRGAGDNQERAFMDCRYTAIYAQFQHLILNAEGNP